MQKQKSVGKIDALEKQSMEDHPTTILYVEDNFDNRILVRRVLESEGYEMLDASTATEAFQQIEKGSPDLILMDINMPEMDGYTLTAKIKENLVVWQTRIDGYRKIWHPCVKRMCSNASKKI